MTPFYDYDKGFCDLYYIDHTASSKDIFKLFFQLDNKGNQVDIVNKC